MTHDESPGATDTRASDKDAREKDAPGLSRRLFLGGGIAAAGAGVGAAAGVGGMLLRDRVTSDSGTELIDLARAESFYARSGEKKELQAGIQTRPQRYCIYMTFDMSTSTASALQVLLARWSAGIAQLQEGKTLGEVYPKGGAGSAPDTGEALDLGPASLTVTVGLGPGIFSDRFGLAHKKPRHLADLPALPSDRLDPALTGGDLSLQACADDPQVAYHAVRDLARMARGTATVRWTVIGFGRASAGKDQTTPRNLMGFKDGTRNIETEDDYRRWVLAKNDASWFNGGTYQVVRKIQMNIEIWDADDIGDQQEVFGRTKVEGAPLSGGTEHSTPNFAAKDKDGETKIPLRSHVALAAHENNAGIKILRRPYNYTDGLNQYGQLDAGLLFITYVNDPENFSALQRKLGASDRLNEYIAHIGSGVFAVPPAPVKGSYIASGLFD